MGFVSVKTGEKIKLSKGYETPSVTYNDWKKQRAVKEPVREKKTGLVQTAGSGLEAAAPGTVGGLVGGMGVGGITPVRASAPQAATVPDWTRGLTGTERKERQEDVHRELERLNRQALDPAVHQNPTRMNQLNQEMKRLRASVGEQSLGDRVESGLGAVFASAGAGTANAAGLATDSAGEFVRAWEGVGSKEIARNRADTTREILRTGRLTDGRPVTPGMRPQLEEALARYEAEYAAAEPQKSFQERHPVLTKAKSGLYGFADRSGEDAARLTAGAKDGLGAAGRLAVDVGIAGGQMGLDALTAALIGGSSLAPMAVRAAGGAAQEARLAGADLEQQIKYGLGSAALSVGTEKISNIAAPFRKMFGTGAAEKIAGSLVKRFGENGAVQMMQRLSQTAGGRIALSAIGEGGEEVVEDVLQPFLKRATYDKTARFDAGEAEHDFLVGAILGGLGGGVEQVGRIGRMTQQERAETGLEADAAAPAGVDAPAVTGRAQGLQESENGAPETLGGPETEVQGGLGADGGTVDVMTQEARQLYGDEKAASETETAVNENGLTALTLLERENLSSGKRNKVISTFQEAIGFVRNALKDKQMLDRAYLGKIPDAVSLQILNDTGIDIRGFGTIINGNDIRHIIKHHGDPMMEAARGLIAVTPEDIARIPEVLSSPDRVYLSPDLDRKGRKVLAFEKEIGNKLVTMQGISGGKKSLQTDTLYVQKGRARTSQDTMPGTKHAAPVINAQSELPQSSSIDSTIPQGADSVKVRDPLLQAILGDKKRVDQASLSPEQFDRAVELNEQGAVGMDAAGKVYQVDPAEHIDRRSGQEITSRKVNAFQYDHPELAAYYREAAGILLEDLNYTQRGGEILSYRTDRTFEGGTGYARSRRMASQEIAELLDGGMSYARIEKALEAMIQDHGAENYADAKRVELVLDRMLTDGFKGVGSWTETGPNTAYIQDKGRIAGSMGGDDGLGAADAGSLNTDFDRLQAESDTFYAVNRSSAQRIMGEQGRAPSEVPVTSPDTGRNIQKTISTILNSPLTSPEMAVELEHTVAEGKFDYIPVTDRDAVKRAQADLSDRGLQRVALEFQTKVELGQRITKYDMAAAAAVYNQAVANGDRATAFEMAVAMADAAHDGAQVVQAMHLMNRLTPEGKLLTLRRFVDRMNRKQAVQGRDARNRARGPVTQEQADFVERETGFRISGELATNYLMAETEAERAAAWDAITTDIAAQMPSTFMDKANFWRYTSMLLNPTTHIRNMAGNAIQAGARTIKNGVGAAIERAALRDRTQRTKSVVMGKEGKALKDFARTQYEADQQAAMGEGKYADGSAAGIEREIQAKRKTFKGENPFSKGAQAVGDFNSRLLDAEDLAFNRSAYVSSFAQALKAKGVSAAEAVSGAKAELIEAARTYAIEEARRATYRNTTALSEALSKMGQYRGSNPVIKAASFAADAFMPFRRTPANILTTGLDYSPVGIGKALKQGLWDLRRGNCTAADVVDSLSAGLTGSGILALGAYLAAEGLLRIRTGDDDREEAYNKDRGMQDYAIQVGDKSYTLDWAVPAAMPLFAGAAIMESVREGGNGFEAVADAMTGISEVVLETSMLSSLNDLLAHWSYAENKVTYLLDRTATGYAGQYVPTLGSKIASAMDDTVRKSYVEQGTGQVASDADYFLQSILKKIPGARSNLQPKIDLWGEEVSNGSAGERVFQNFFSPGYGKTVDGGELDQELRRLAEAVGSSAVYPKEVEKSFTVGNGMKYLTAEEYTRYARKVGQTRKQVVSALLDSEGYRRLDEEGKAAVIADAYEYANAAGKMAVSNYRPGDSSVAAGAMKSLLPPASYILYRKNKDRDRNGNTTYMESALTLRELPELSDKQRGEAWAAMNANTKQDKNPFTGALPQAGLSVERSLEILGRYKEFDDRDDLTPKEKGQAFKKYVNGLGLSREQVGVLKETLRFGSGFSVEW